MKVGDIVEPISHYHTLASGCCEYNCAVVISMEPFMLVSYESDMLWGTSVFPVNYKVIGTATQEVLDRCMRRIDG